MKCLSFYLVFLAVLAAAEANEPYRTTHELKLDERVQDASLREVRSYMDLVVFPTVKLSKTSFADAVNWVQHEIANHAPASVPADRVYGFSTVLKVHPGKPEIISVSLHNVTLPEVLDAICTKYDYVWCLEPYALTIIPKASSQVSHAADSTRSPRIPQPIRPMGLWERARALFAECYLRVMTYAEMGGEKDEELNEQVYSVLHALGDAAFAESLRVEPIEVQSAMRLILSPADTEGYPQTAAILRNAPRRVWPTEVYARKLCKRYGLAPVEFDDWGR